MKLDEALDRIFAAPLEEFTPTRNALAKELAGDDAKQVRSLKKPNLAAWALNQLSRRHPDALDELMAVTDRVRKAQRRVLSGGKASALREAADERNKVVSTLTKLAGNILIDAGHAAAASTLSAVSDALVASASNEEGAARLKRGVLEREFRAESTVGDVGGLTVVRDEEEEEEADGELEKEKADRAAREAARKKLSEAEKAAKEAESDAWQKERDVEKAERALKNAREAAEFARRAADARREEAEAAEKDLDALKR